MTNQELIARTIHEMLHLRHSWEGSDEWQRTRSQGYAQFLCKALTDAGRVIVPQEPTNEMIASGYDVCRGHIAVRHIYRAMIAVAQEPPS